MIDIQQFENFLVFKGELGTKTIADYLRVAKLVNLRGDLTQELYETIVLEGRAKSPSYTNVKINVINHWIDYLDYKNIPHSLKKLTPKRNLVKPIHIVLTKNEIKSIIAQSMFYSRTRAVNTECNNKFRAGFLFLALTGCRVGEMCGLKVKDVDLERKECWFYHTKNGHDRKATLTPELVERLRPLCTNPESWLFHTRPGGQCNQKIFNEDLHRRAKQAGITKDVHCHLFRHSMATALLENDVPIATVAQALGHKNINVTFAQYAHISDHTVREAITHLPMVHETLTAQELLDELKDKLSKLELKDDDRFLFKYEESKQSIQLIVAVK